MESHYSLYTFCCLIDFSTKQVPRNISGAANIYLTFHFPLSPSPSLAFFFPVLAGWLHLVIGYRLHENHYSDIAWEGCNAVPTKMVKKQKKMKLHGMEAVYGRIEGGVGINGADDSHNLGNALSGSYIWSIPTKICTFHFKCLASTVREHFSWKSHFKTGFRTVILRMRKILEWHVCG